MRPITTFAIAVCLAFNLSAQKESVTADQLAMARKVMNTIEAQYLRSGDDQKASGLILEAKLANESAYTYLLQLPGYEQAVKDEALLDYMEDMKKEYKEYRKLAKEAEKAQERKREYLSSVDNGYHDAAALYDEVD